MKISTLLQRFTSLFALRLFGAVLMFGANLLIARMWSGEVLGLFSLLLAANAVMAQLIGLGFSSIATVLASRFKATDQLAKLRGLCRDTGQLRALVTVLVLPLGAAYLTWATPLSGMGLWATAAVLALSAYAIASLSFFGAVLVAFDQQVRAALPEVAFRPLLFAGALLGASALSWPQNAAGLFLLFAVANVAALLLSQTFVRRFVPLGSGPPDTTERPEWRRSAPPWVVTTLVWDFFIEVQILLAGLLLLPAKQVAMLHVCFRLRSLAGFGMRALYMLLLPRVYEQHAKGMSTTKGILQLQGLGALYGLAVLAGCMLLGEWVLGLFGPAFEEALPVLLVVCAVIFFRGVFGPASALLAMHGQHRLPSVVMVMCLVGSAASAPFAVNHLGMMGIALGYTFWSALGTAVLYGLLLMQPKTETAKAS
ncbi:lipopolysaccharide biosynthesis protein [Pseudovibrio sp. SPO723]|uniref:lipopolysaccharide biosynthesis protein n=1 Tax=Nesiotobacter zosterae TaxID=392721 RepID=UPI0029C4F4DE|nr:lipopolysaccharide biosynthesis protein [Pseudovibrio sp. SPO723]MDX5593299.1 lipopolysaccharide biosynthesis protein [Pseudovibrio sp. SPO723]